LQLDSKTIYYIILGLAVLVAVVFSLLIFVTGKGDAMSGGSGSIRTTFKGRATFDDAVSNLTLWLGGGFILLMLILDWLGTQIFPRT
jgi:preprotein translocase subunit SecG